MTIENQSGMGRLAAATFVALATATGFAQEWPKLAKISNREAVERLLKLAKDCGGSGITMECVDYGNYSPDVCEAIRTFCAGE